MKKKFFCLILIMIISIISVSAQTRIAVLPFSPGDNIDKSNVTYLTQEFTLAMLTSDKYIVLERMELDKAMKELQLQNSDDFDETQAAEVGKLAGAEQVFFGNVYSIAGQYTVSVRCVDIRTGAITFAKKGVSPDDKTLIAVCKKIALQIVSGDTSSSTVKIEFTAKERKIKENYIEQKCGISPTNKEDMLMQYKRNLACGITLAAVGVTHLLAGIITISALCSYDGINNTNGMGMIIGPVVGIQLLVSSIIITPICALPFMVAKHVKSIYDKSTGEKLMSFFQRTTLGTGYNWDKKEVTVAMAIRL